MNIEGTGSTEYWNKVKVEDSAWPVKERKGMKFKDSLLYTNGSDSWTCSQTHLGDHGRGSTDVRLSSFRWLLVLVRVGSVLFRPNDDILYSRSVKGNYSERENGSKHKNKQTEKYHVSSTYYKWRFRKNVMSKKKKLLPRITESLEKPICDLVVI